MHMWCSVSLGLKMEISQMARLCQVGALRNTLPETNRINPGSQRMNKNSPVELLVVNPY